MSGDHSDTVPPDPISNSVVKRISGDGSVGIPHVRVAHRQTPNSLRRDRNPHVLRVFLCLRFMAKINSIQVSSSIAFKALSLLIPLFLLRPPK